MEGGNLLLSVVGMLLFVMFIFAVAGTELFSGGWGVLARLCCCCLLGACCCPPCSSLWVVAARRLCAQAACQHHHSPCLAPVP
jgi:hypothetical protein